ncbi:MAG: DUF971 domain-containing protein [Planctomycetaceae bacterium]
MVQTPSNIRALSADRQLEISWPEPDPRVDRLSFRRLRESCPCAACIDEMTGRLLLDVAAIPDDIRPVKLSGVGHYAVKILWSDGHDTGLYTWEHLELLGRRHAPES